MSDIIESQHAMLIDAGNQIIELGDRKILAHGAHAGSMIFGQHLHAPRLQVFHEDRGTINRHVRAKLAHRRAKNFHTVERAAHRARNAIDDGHALDLLFESFLRLFALGNITRDPDHRVSRDRRDSSLKPNFRPVNIQTVLNIDGLMCLQRALNVREKEIGFSERENFV